MRSWRSARYAARRTASHGLRYIERVAVSARDRLDRNAGDGILLSPSRPEGRARYGQLWDPPDLSDAMCQILNSSDTETFEATGKEEAARISGYIDQSATVLDLGCGIGRVTRYVSPLCKMVWAVDASERMLELARHRLKECSNIRFARCADTVIPDIPSGSVDLAYSFLVLQHVEREDAFLLLKEIRRVLRPDGVALITFPNLLSKMYLDSFLGYATSGEVTNPARARIYTPQEVSQLLPAAGFDAQIEPGVEILCVCRPR